MKLDCPVCSHRCDGDSQFAVELELVAHVKANPDTKHLDKLSDLMESIDRHVTFAVSAARDNHEINLALYDKLARFDVRLKTIYLYAVSHLTIAMQAARDAFIDAGLDGRVTEQTSGKSLWRNLQESLLVAERKYKR